MAELAQVLRDALLLAVEQGQWALVADLAMHLKVLTERPVEAPQEPAVEVESTGSPAVGQPRMAMLGDDDEFEFDEV